MARIKIEGVRHHKCDWCKEDFTDTGKPHLTIEVGERSGWSSLATLLPGWRFIRMLRPGYLDFCGASCIASFFAVVLVHSDPEHMQ